MRTFIEQTRPSPRVLQNEEESRHLVGGTETGTVQTPRYSLTPHDAEVFRELVAFLGEDVFDQRRKDGAIAKSDAFQRRISEARSVLRLIGAYDEASLNEKTLR